MQPYTPPPYMQQPPPPQGSGTNVALIVGLVVVLVIVLPVSLLVCAGAVGYFRARSAARSAYTPYTTYGAYSPSPTPTAIPSTLTETYPASNGLVTAHYPADFAAKALDHATIMLSRNKADGTDEVVTVAGVANPISDDVNEFSRILIQGMKKNIEASGDRWTETSRRRTTCFGSYAGLEVKGTFTAQGITKENVRICYFMQTNRGYEMKTIVPAIHESTDLPLLQSMVDATDIK